MLGTDAWERELYAAPTQGDLLSPLGNPAELQREADVKGLEGYVFKRLGALSPMVFDPLALPAVRKPQRFSLFCALSNPDPKLMGLAKKLVSYALKAGKSSHV
jgi:hypothetical protein